MSSRWSSSTSQVLSASCLPIPLKPTIPYVNADPSSKTIVTWLAAKENDNSAFSFHPVTDEQIKNVLEEGFTYQLAAKEGLQFVTLPIDAEFTEEDAMVTSTPLSVRRQTLRTLCSRL